MDDFVEAVEDEFNGAPVGAVGSLGWADAIGREEVVVIANVDVVIADVARRDANNRRP